MGVTHPSDHPGRHDPGHLLSLVSDGVLDAELAALVSLLVEARVPVVVAGDVDAPLRGHVLDAVLATLPDEIRHVPLHGVGEDFAWMPEAESLGWRSDGATPGRSRSVPARADTTAIVARELAPSDAGSAWAGVVRIAVRAVSLGYTFGGSLRGGTLEDVLGTLRAAPFRLTEDELSRLGLVVVLEARGGGQTRVVAAHYLRPVARDMHGHVQKLGPAVLATWDEASERWEHFAWGVIPELALRTGRRAGDFEIEQERRAAAFASGTLPGVEPAARPRDDADRPARHDHDHDHEHAPHEHDHDHARTPR